MVTKFLIWRPIGHFFYLTCYGDGTYIKLKLITSTFTWWSPNFWFGAQLGAFFLFYMLWGWDIHQIKANNKYFHMVVTKFLIWRPIGRFFLFYMLWGWDIHQIKANNKYFHMVGTKFLIWRPIGRFFLFYMLWGWDIHQIKANNKYFHMVVTKFLIWRPIGPFKKILLAMGMRHTSN